MKILYCDLCETEYRRLSYESQNNFMVYYNHPYFTPCIDICSQCLSRITKVQNDEIEKIKKEKDEKNN